MTCDKTAEQLAREEVERQALERAAKALESYSVGDAYRKAFRKAIDVIRSLKP